MKKSVENKKHTHFEEEIGRFRLRAFMEDDKFKFIEFIEDDKFQFIEFIDTKGQWKGHVYNDDEACRAAIELFTSLGKSL